VTVIVAIVAATTRLNPLWLLLVGGALGFAGMI
jgi:chromate transporter